MCAQTDEDLEAAAWGLLAWENPLDEDGLASPFWRDSRCRGRVAGLRLANGALVVKIEWGDAAALVRIAHTGASDPDGGLVLRLAFGLDLPLALARVRDLLLALDGKPAGKTHRLIAIDLYGACLVLWGSIGGSRSYLPLSG